MGPQYIRTCKPNWHTSVLVPWSCHAQHCTASIPYSQSLRLKRICYRTRDFTVRTNQLKTHLLARGYNKYPVDQQIQKATNVPRTESLQPHQPRQQLQRTPLVVTFHPYACLSSLPNIARKHLNILHASRRLEKAIHWCHSDGPETYEIYCMSDLRKPSSTPPLTSFRRPRNLRNLPVPGYRLQPLPPRMTTPPAAAVGANAAKRRIETCNTFKSNSTGRKYIFKITTKPQ